MSIARKTPLKPGKKPKARRNPKQRAKVFARVYGSKERVAWVQGLPSVVSGEGPCQNVHTRTGGTGRKADACWIVPLTRSEHHDLHQLGKPAFEMHWGVELDHAARMTEQAWQAYCCTYEEE